MPLLCPCSLGIVSSLYERLFSLTPNTCCLFHHQFSDSPTPTGYPMTQLNSDAIWTWRRPQRSRVQLHRLPSLQKPVASPSTSDQMPVSVGISTTYSLRFNNSLEQLTELRKMLYLHFPVYYKRYISGTAKWKRCIGHSMGVRAVVWSFRVLPRHVTLSAPQYVPPGRIEVCGWVELKVPTL